MKDLQNLIIVVEDDFIIAQDLKEIIESEGFKVICESESVDNAIKIIKDLNPVLVVLDINLKAEKDGIEIGKFLLDYDKIPFIYVTSYSDTLTINRVKETRPYGYIKKPFNPVDIITNINIILNNFYHRNIDILRIDKDLNSLNDEIPFILRRIINYINTNINETIEIDQLVIQTRWEKPHFSRMFKKYLGITPYQYILNQKIEKSKSILKETNNQIFEIAYELGFNSHSNFTTRFKKITGYSPDDYRRIHNTRKWME
jgi:AraC-like DNA-binding protein